MNNSEFYIGWQNKAPASFSRHIKKVIVILGCLLAITVVLLSLQQRKFSTASFEFGQLTQLKGIYQNQPVPSIKVITKKDAFGNSTFITIPLVGYGKFGAEGTIAALEKERNLSLDKKEITIKGTLLFSDGKTLLQIDKNDDPLVSVSTSTSHENVISNIEDLGAVELTGEILDPKCYFGVMKPGYGKPHRDCAIRCIAGGMSPVFCVRNEKGQANYYLLLGANGEKINEQLQDYIADPVFLKAKAVQYDDWIVLYVDGKNNIKRTGGLSWYKTNNASCGVSCKK